MFLSRLDIQGFKSFPQRVRVDFGPGITAVVGPNGSGKTSVLQGIHSLTQLAVVVGGDPDVALAKLTEFTSIGGEDEYFAMRMEGSRSAFGPYSIEVDRKEPQQVLGILRANEPDPAGVWRVASNYHNGQWGANHRHQQLLPADAKRFDATAFIRFSAGQLATPTLIRTDPPQITKEGAGLASTLRVIKSKDESRFKAIEKAFCQVIPGATGIRTDIDRVPGSEVYGDILLVDYRGVKGVRANHVSSGTLFALGLLTVMMRPDSANVILLDDLDHGLHPKAQMELIQVFRNLIEQNPELQIIATSHSPYILSKLEWNEVWVTGLRDDGSATCARLDRHPEVERWREAMTPGEFWSHAGDDWVKKLDKPQPATAAP